MPKYCIKPGDKFGMLTALEVSHVSKRKVFWKVRCDCGRENQVITGALRSGNTKSCGCQGGRNMPPDMPLIDKVLTNITMEPNSGCWLFLRNATFNKAGGMYGYVFQNGKSHRVHRVTYEHFVGPIPDGLVLDHKCRVTLCVNPNHLRPMTNYANAALGVPHAHQLAKTHCPQGHPYSGDNLYFNSKRRNRVCRTCTRARGRIRNAKVKLLRSMGATPHQSPR